VSIERALSSIRFVDYVLFLFTIFYFGLQLIFVGSRSAYAGLESWLQ
jgi:hypothetical protein